MQKRKLGRTELDFAPLVLGGNVFGWTIDTPRSLEIIDAFVERGFSAIDTADVYSAWVPGNKGGESESVIGEWIKTRRRRDKIQVFTKVGMEMAPDKKGLKKEHIVRSVEDSLRRLQTDYIDLYQAHTDDQETPLEESLRAFDQLIKDGKVRYIGASNYSGARLGEALQLSKAKGLAAYASLQPNYNLYDRDDFEHDLQQVCLDAKVGVIPYFSLAKGFLSGKYRSANDASKSVRGAKIAEQYLNEKGFRILAALDECASQLQASHSQISLAWLMRRPAITAPIVSATSIEQLHDICASADLELNDSIMDKLTLASRAV